MFPQQVRPSSRPALPARGGSGLPGDADSLCLHAAPGVPAAAGRLPGDGGRSLGPTLPSLWLLAKVGNIRPSLILFTVASSRIPLKTDNFKIGRLIGDFIISASALGDTRWYNTISQTQCEISRTEDGVFLTDLSTNGEFLLLSSLLFILLVVTVTCLLSGTWVDGHKVGKNSMWPLENNAEIAFAGANKKVFVFISNEETEETFPEELTTKYTVSRVLGAGASAEVRLAFRIPDMHRVAIKLIRKQKNNSALNSKSR